MKKSILTMLGVAILATCTSEALSQHPTFSVPPNQTVNNVWCDERPYFLVFQEDFKGRKDPSWLTYVTYKGMVSENDNWGGARAPEIIDENTHQAKMIMLDKNVTLSNDHLILSNYKENAIWRCDTCYSGPFLWSKYTGGMVALPYNNKSLNYGKVEVRAWMSSHNYAHHAVFLWYGVNCNNEVDLIEAFGRQPHLPGNISLRDKTHGSYDTHEWNSEENQMCIDPLDPWARRRSDIHIASTHSSANTYMRHAFKKNRYGYENNDFRNLFKRYRKDIYKMDQWHTYTLVWDSAEVVFKMDNFEVGAIPKWYVRQLVGRRYPKCSEKNKEIYNFNNGYPWDKVSLSQLRISSGVAKEASLPAGEANLPNGHLGDVLIDYVKIWQKDSVSTGYSVWGKWKDPCMADPTPRINGQDWLCYGSSAQYKISVHQPGGYWEIPAGFSTSDPLTGGTITLTRTNGLMYTNAVLKYHYKKSSSCDVKTVYFNLYCYRDGIEPATPFMVPISDNAGNRSLFFFDHTDYIGIARTPDERKKYNWEFKFIYPDTTINISRQGRFVDIPSDQVVRYNSDLVEMPYDLNISIGIDFPFEQEFVNVSKYITNANYQTNIIPIPEDTSMQLFHAYIDDIDSFNAQWDTLVDNFLFFEYELEDSVYLQEIRNQLKADLLAPYILEMQDSAVEGTISAGLKGIVSSLELYPNPATQILNVKAELLKPEGQSIAIYDLYGKLMLRQEIKNDHIQIDVASFASGLYIVALSDNGRIIERKKFVKH